MKKIVLVALMSMALFSCGKEKKTEEVKAQPEKVNRYVVKMEAVYPEDDSISVIYKTDTYFQYEKAVSFKVKGSPVMQNLSIAMPEGVAVENIMIFVSTNKNQKKLNIKDVLITNDGQKVFDVTNPIIADYFDFNPGVVLNVDRSVDVNFKGDYPPGITGNLNLEAEFSSKK